MIHRLISIFIIFITIQGFAGEVGEAINICQSDLIQTIDSNFANGNDNPSAQLLIEKVCDIGDCHAEESHCTHHCSGFHNIFSSHQILKFKNFHQPVNKKMWYFTFSYLPPFLEKSIRPPLHS